MDPTIQQLKKALEKKSLVIPYFAIHNDTCICGFFGPARFLSNFWTCPNGILWEGIKYSTTEHAFQAAKLPKQLRSDAVNLTCSQVKKLGRSVDLPKNWHDIKYRIMNDLITLKFTTDENLKQKLLDTKNKYLEERNDWGDRCWGTDEKGVGENNLGKILMEVRSKLL